MMEKKKLNNREDEPAGDIGPHHFYQFGSGALFSTPVRGNLVKVNLWEKIKKLFRRKDKLVNIELVIDGKDGIITKEGNVLRVDVDKLMKKINERTKS